MRRDFYAILVFCALILTACNLTTQQATPTITSTNTLPPSDLATLPVVLPSPNFPTQSQSATAQIQNTPQAILPVGERTGEPPNLLTQVLTIVSTREAIAATATIVFPTAFPDRYTVPLNTGSTLLVNYDVTIHNPGTGRVFIKVLDPAGVELFRLVITSTEKNTAEIPVATSGEHIILAAFENLSGNYSVSYGFR